MAKLLEGRWDCSNCLTANIKGRHKSCPACGDPRNPNLTPSEKPYLPSDAEEVMDSELHDLFSAGADWNCGHCGTANRGDTGNCSHCNRPKDADDDYVETATYYSGESASGIQFDNPDTAKQRRVDDLIDDFPERLRQLGIDGANTPDTPITQHLPETALRRKSDLPHYIPSTQHSVRQWASSNKRRVGIGGGIAGGIGVAWISFASFFATEPTTVTVRDLSWSRSVEVEAFRTLNDSGWNYPSDAYNVRSEREIRSYRDVLDHYETKTRQVSEQVYVGQDEYEYACGTRTIDNGNGSFSQETEYCTSSQAVYETRYRTESYQEPVYRQEPVYDTKYYYNVDRWVTDSWLDTSGNTRSEYTRTPEWAEVQNLASTQRKGDERRETYTAIVTDEHGKDHSFTISLTEWSALSVGESLDAEITRQGTVKDVVWPDS